MDRNFLKKLLSAMTNARKKAKYTRTHKKMTPEEELAIANAMVKDLAKSDPKLLGINVKFGPTPGGFQAVCYYQKGEIVVNPKHKAPIDTIISHELWHVIDWKDNGRIDWGENVPPKP